MEQMIEEALRNTEVTHTRLWNKVNNTQLTAILDDESRRVLGNVFMTEEIKCIAVVLNLI